MEGQIMLFGYGKSTESKKKEGGFYFAGAPEKHYVMIELLEQVKLRLLNIEKLENLRNDDQAALVKGVIGIQKELDGPTEREEFFKDVFTVDGYDDPETMAKEVVKTSYEEVKRKYGKRKLLYVSGSDRFDNKEDLDRFLSRLTESGKADLISNLKVVLMRGETEEFSLPACINSTYGSYGEVTTGSILGVDAPNIHKLFASLPAGSVHTEFDSDGNPHYWVLYQVEGLADSKKKKQKPVTRENAIKKIESFDNLTEGSFRYVTGTWMQNKKSEWIFKPDFEGTNFRTFEE